MKDCLRPKTNKPGKYSQGEIKTDAAPNTTGRGMTTMFITLKFLPSLAQSTGLSA
jgi:hypothetical protein